MQYQSPTDRAAELGRQHGKDAASWVFDGNTPDSTYRAVLAGIEDGDPEVLDAYRVPDLSSEFADSYTTDDLLYDLCLPDLTRSGDPDVAEWVTELETAWLDGASDGFWSEVERRPGGRRGRPAAS